MRILALDPGTRRVGVAISDETGTLALPLEVIAAEPAARLLERLQQIINSSQVGLIVVGIPRNMNGTYGPSAQNARQFAAGLEKSLGIPIKNWDERWTSVQANRLLLQAGVRGQKRRAKADQSAAAILLQSYLDARAMPGAC
jgi:putative Holliday junction resolvase